jgi:hypothetical protein
MGVLTLVELGAQELEVVLLVMHNLVLHAFFILGNASL